MYQKKQKTDVYQNKANDYAIFLPEQMSEENGVTIENGKTRIGIIPVDGDYTHSVIKDNQVYIYPKGKKLKDAKYLLEAPSMEDAAGEISFLIKLELREEDRKTKAIRQDTALT